MNIQKVNNRVSQLIHIMSGKVHAFAQDGRSLSKFAYTVSPFERRCLPSPY
ncbi:hypothetical protein FHS18_002807 [Paenibacillus phyllosphaerae]|uniref:Uncharacterized protein n=1 Tax=Paenibacillus phyllosphaerae TaxID=274593 RepID=A0A7W5FMY8_9BACL|nr:hypothetical protein [Paenibacillus phyllosphaerae]